MIIPTIVFIGCALIFKLAAIRAKEYEAEREQIAEQARPYTDHGC